MMRRNRDMDERAIAIQNRAGKIVADVLIWMLIAWIITDYLRGM